MRGRPPKILPFSVPEDSPIYGEPKMPRDLDALAKKKWRAMIKSLTAAGIVTKLDGDTIATFCRLSSEEAQIITLLAAAPNPFVLDDGAGRLILNPLRRELAKVREHLLRVRGELGLAPVSRTRLNLGPKKAAGGIATRDRSKGPPPPKEAM